MNRRDAQFQDEIVTILRKIYGDNWDYDFDVEEDGIYLRLNVWGEPDKCADCHETGDHDEWAEEAGEFLLCHECAKARAEVTA